MINRSPFIAAAALFVAGAIPAAAADGDKSTAEHPPTSAMDEATPTMESPKQPEASVEAAKGDKTSDPSDKSPAVHPPTKAMDQAVPQMKPDDKPDAEK